MTTGRAGARRGDPSPTDVADRMIGFSKDGIDGVGIS